MQKVSFTCTDLPSKTIDYQPIRIAQQFTNMTTGIVVEQYLATVDKKDLLTLIQALQSHRAKLLET